MTEFETLYDLRDAHKKYQVGAVPVQALHGVSLQIRRGESIALVGPSGSGKTTLLNVLGLIETLSQGELYFQGNAITSVSETELTRLRRQSIGFIFQNFNLIGILTALENVEYALYLDAGTPVKAIRDRAREILASVGMEKFTEHKPAQLSGGQRQRVAIARALAKRPAVVLADEPTANLDSRNAEQIFNLLAEMKEKAATCVIVATHDVELASLLDRRLNLRDGETVTETAKAKWISGR